MKQIKLLFLLFLMLLPMVANADYSGNCGYNVYYTYNEATKTLVISGTGSIRSYYNNDTPWNKSTLIVRNNGIINMATGKEFSAPKGCIVNVDNGEIN